MGPCDVGGLTAFRLLDSSADLHDVRPPHHDDLTVRPVRLAQALARMEAAAETRRRRG